jgi:septal ring factor EnvC (AmiA/AmiB activator)
MSTISILWAALASVLGSALILQGIALRTAYRRKFARQHAKQLQLQQTVNDQFEQAMRQICQLQNELAAARLQLKRVGKSAAASRQALERELDRAEALRHRLPVNGFADTQPSPQVTQLGSLLLP